jgi:uncharacterized membrane protein
MTGHEQTTGATIGGLMGFVKSLTIISIITWMTVFETAVLAAVGAMIGFLVTGLMKYMKRKLFDKK